MLDEIEVGLYEKDEKKIMESREILSLYDINMFNKDKKTYIKALKLLDNKKAKELLSNPYKEEDKYKIFHNLNREAILKTVEFFQKHKNITSYKIPSRGREFYKYLYQLEDEKYNYKESQYRL